MIAYVPIYAVCELCGQRFHEELRIEISDHGRVEHDVNDVFRNGAAGANGGYGHGREHSYYCNACAKKRKAGE